MSNLPPIVPPVQPVTLSYAQPVNNKIREIATRQKSIMYCILAYLAVIVLMFTQIGNPQAALIILLVALAVLIFGAVCAFRLSLVVFDSQGVGITMGILTLIPYVGLIILLVINGKATGILKRNNIKVGLLGAKASQIPQATH
jgi:hypothetical protein